jgi:hypothetical protein
MADENTTDVTEETASATDTGADGHVDEPLGEGGKKALTAERKLREKAEKALATHQQTVSELQKRLQEFEDRDKTEAQKLADAKAAAESEAATAKQELMRYRVAAKKKLPPELVPRLQGGTEAEMEADADSLLEVLKIRNTPSYDGGVRKPAPAPTDMNALIRAKAGLG